MKVDKVKLKELLKTVGQSLLIIYGLIAIGLMLVLNLREMYYYDMVKMKLNGVSGFSLELIKTNYDILMDYINPFSSGELHFKELRMTPEAMQHFVRVKRMIQIVLATGLVSIIYSIYNVIKRYKRKDGEFFRRAVITTFLVPMIICAFAITDWSGVFNTFHKIFFTGDKWHFSWFDDEVIRILPDKYFMQCALIIVGVMFVGCISVWVAWYRLELGDVISRQRFKDGKLVEEFNIGNETFDRCFKYKLIELDGIVGWKLTAKDNISRFSCKKEFKGYPVISLNGTFENYWYKEISVNEMRVDNVIDISKAFENCRASTIDIRNWSVDNIKNADKAFKSKYIKEIKMRHSNWSKLLSANEMFNGSEANVSGFNYLDIKDMNNIKDMFKRFNGKIVIKISNCKSEDISSITDIIDVRTVESEKDADEMIERAKELKVDRMIIMVKVE